MDVIQRLKQKEEAALRELMEQYGDYLLRTAVLLLRDRQAAEEAVQDTFIQAFENIAQLRDGDKLRSWLTRIAVNRCRMRQRKWDWRHIFPMPRMDQHVNESVPAVDEMLGVHWREAEMIKSVQQLPYTYREVITLYYYNELGVQEIAAQLQLNINTVKARLMRGRHKLRQIVVEKGESDA
ncbi:RNA polymerase [Paenibacillus glucanolyticus]|uniref:RNA polymerase n=2 Tax=Paenibacillus TaxID=44249 RepID=A0A163EKG4_9BACL|nr:sigma-70 family RNA polymerase sigma factor [Paenibacillus glucanolyticus]ANA83275.1 RNA polymerase [Paenibacillus glucanolyticus]KZS43850.1 RNA polymerase [Paenibacillus glucanolyticus]